MYKKLDIRRHQSRPYIGLAWGGLGDLALGPRGPGVGPPARRPARGPGAGPGRPQRELWGFRFSWGIFFWQILGGRRPLRALAVEVFMGHLLLAELRRTAPPFHALAAEVFMGHLLLAELRRTAPLPRWPLRY